MHVKIKTIGDTPLPNYETAGAAAFDVRAREETIIQPHTVGLIPTGLIIEIPEGFFLLLTSRSSTPKKKGLLVPHGVGIIDQDYCGEDDEIMLQLYNFTEKPVVVEKGERIGQAVFVKIDKAQWSKTESMDRKNRGGFGSTGKH